MDDNELSQTQISPLVSSQAVVGLLRNLALCPANHTSIRENSGVHRLVELLVEAKKDIEHGAVAGSPAYVVRWSSQCFSLLFFATSF